MNNKKVNQKRKSNIILHQYYFSYYTSLITKGYIYINKALDKIETIEVNTDNIAINTETKEEFKEIKKIVLLGIDSRDNDLVGSSDFIMILTLDTIHNKIKFYL